MSEVLALGDVAEVVAGVGFPKDMQGDQDGAITNGRMQEITGEHSKDITAVLQNLVRDGLLTQQNQRRWASYRVVEDSPQLDRLAGLSPEILNLLPLAELARTRKNKKLPVDQLKGIIQQPRFSRGSGQEYIKQLK